MPTNCLSVFGHFVDALDKHICLNPEHRNLFESVKEGIFSWNLICVKNPSEEFRLLEFVKTSWNYLELIGLYRKLEVFIGAQNRQGVFLLRKVLTARNVKKNVKNGLKTWFNMFFGVLKKIKFLCLSNNIFKWKYLWCFNILQKPHIRKILVLMLLKKRLGQSDVRIFWSSISLERIYAWSIISACR